MEKKMETTSLGFRGLGFGIYRRYPQCPYSVAAALLEKQLCPATAMHQVPARLPLAVTYLGILRLYCKPTSSRLSSRC